jgi:hypothetical protein
MRRLSVGQPVTLKRPHSHLRGHVVAVAGEEAWVEAHGGVPPAPGEPPAGAELEFVHRGTPVLLFGALAADPSGCVRFTVAEPGAHLRDPRQAPRIGLRLPATLTPAGAAGTPVGRPMRLETVDVSAGGLLLDRGGIVAAGRRARVLLELTPTGHLDLLCKVVRTSAQQTAVAFVDLPEEVRRGLADTVVALRRALVRGAAALAEPVEALAA